MLSGAITKVSNESDIKNYSDKRRYPESGVFLEGKRIFRYINSTVSASVTTPSREKNESSVSMMESIYVNGWVDKAKFLTKQEFLQKLKKNG